MEIIIRMLLQVFHLLLLDHMMIFEKMYAFW